MEPSNKISEKEIIESIKRSGYLLESQITKELVKKGFFVESNITSFDPLTNKSREIDLQAEYNYDWIGKADQKAAARTKFIFEIKNNNFPLVLLTTFEYSPDSFIWNGLKTYQTFPPKVQDIYFSSYYEVLFGKDKKQMFTQYCSFSKKKNEELMAHHPDNIYSSLSKLTMYCEECAESNKNNLANSEEKYFRNFLYLPILLINDDLYQLELIENDTTKLTKVDYSRLVFNYHYKQRHCSSIVYVITKHGLDLLLNEILEAEKVVETEMIKVLQDVA